MSTLDVIDEYPHDGRFYLLEEITNKAGFFVVDGLPVYGVLSRSSSKSAPVRTALLELDLGIDLVPVKSGEETSSQTFDLIRMVTTPTEREVDAFLTLCRDHAKGNSGLTLREFFFAASKLFRPNTAQGRKNAIGLFGELILIKRAASSDYDLSICWQKLGNTSKYDFVLPNMNIEVKTTTKREMITRIKHDQLFNHDRNVLAFCRIEKSPTGITLRDLAYELRHETRCFKTLDSRLALASELLAIDDGELEVPYKLVALDLFDCDVINPLQVTPQRLTSISYDFDLTGLYVIEFEEVLKQSID